MPNTPVMIRRILNTPTLTTATAWSNALTGVGATMAAALVSFDNLGSDLSSRPWLLVTTIGAFVYQIIKELGKTDAAGAADPNYLIAIIDAAGDRTAGIAIALDRQERGQGERSAAQEVEAEFGIPCVAIAALDDLIAYLKAQAVPGIDINAIQEYRERYGVS